MESENPLEFTEVSAEDVVAKAMAEFKSVMAEEHDKEHDEILAEKESEILEAVRKQAETDAELYRKLAPLLVLAKGNEPAELEAAMSTILSAEEIQTIKDTFLFETYQVEVYTCSIPGPKSFVNFLRDGKNIFPTITLASSSDVEAATRFQQASIVVEVVMLVLSAIGIKIFISEQQMAKVCKSVELLVKKPAFQRSLTSFKKGWDKGGGANRAKAIFNFLKDSYSAGVFWKIIKAVLFQMSWWQYAKTAAIITTMIVAAFATGGAVLIAKIILALDSAYVLVKKMRNLEALEKVQLEESK